MELIARFELATSSLPIRLSDFYKRAERALCAELRILQNQFCKFVLQVRSVHHE